MKYWDNLVFTKEEAKTEKGIIIFFNIYDNNVSECNVCVGDTILYKDEKYSVLNIERFKKSFDIPGDNYTLLIKKLSEIMLDETRELVKKWDAVELLKELKPCSDLDKMAKLLESVPVQKIPK